GCQRRTRPQSQRKPWGPRSKQGPPTRGSRPIHSRTGPDQVYSGGHHCAIAPVKTSKACPGSTGTVTERRIGSSVIGAWDGVERGAERGPSRGIGAQPHAREPDDAGPHERGEGAARE